jgi:hypothetical protein
LVLGVEGKQDEVLTVLIEVGQEGAEEGFDWAGEPAVLPAGSCARMVTVRRR